MAIAGRANFASIKEVELAQIKDGAATIRVGAKDGGKQTNCKNITHSSVPRQFLQVTLCGDDMQSFSYGQDRQCDVRQTAMVFEVPGWPPCTS